MQKDMVLTNIVATAGWAFFPPSLLAFAFTSPTVSTVWNGGPE